MGAYRDFVRGDSVGAGMSEPIKDSNNVSPTLKANKELQKIGMRLALLQKRKDELLKFLRVAGCDKRRYWSEIEAIGMAAKLRGPLRSVSKLRAYKCPKCDGWHLTKKTK